MAMTQSRILKAGLSRIMPAAAKRALVIGKEKRALQRIPKVACNPESLRPVADLDLKKLFSLADLKSEWEEVRRNVDPLGIPEMAGGVNPGDRRAVYTLIRKLKPRAVLEAGTHIGASTLHIALALSRNAMESDQSAQVLSVDIADVNDPIVKPWMKYGMKVSPAEMMKKMNVSRHVEFITEASVDYIDRCSKKFDFIFLDGDHAAATVYKEVPAALRVLEKDGVILLHDYFPSLQPLWSNGSVIPGPFLATERLKAEGAKVVVLPLGELPWPTKLRSSVTSLALLLADKGQNQ